LLNAISSVYNQAEAIQAAAGITKAEITSRISNTVATQAKALLDAMPTDQQAADKYSELSRLTRADFRPWHYLREYGVQPLRFPENWNALVAKYVYLPEPSLFTIDEETLPKFRAGEYPTYTKWALDTEDLTRIVIAYSYATAKKDRRDELGPLLYDRLVRRVTAYIRQLEDEAEASSASENS
jgi:hypothetical protein